MMAIDFEDEICSEAVRDKATLRDQFAMAALPWALELNKAVAMNQGAGGHRVVPGAAKDAYEIADAMLAARGGK